MSMQKEAPDSPGLIHGHAHILVENECLQSAEIHNKVATSTVVFHVACPIII